MLSLGPLGFAAPWALIGLIALPALWLLLRATPPAPRRIAFPPVRLLLGLEPHEETPLRTPWWVIALRMALAAAVIIGLARPVVFPQTIGASDAPLLLVVDDGWPSAPRWRTVQRQARAALAAAAQANREAAIVFTAPRPGAAAELRLGAPADARAQLNARTPAPWAPDPTATAARLEAARAGGALPARMDVVWLSDGVGHDGGEALAQSLAAFGPGRVRAPTPAQAPLALGAPENTTDGLAFPVYRARADGPREGAVLALDEAGRAVVRAPFAFAPDATQTRARAGAPLEVRNLITHVRLETGASAGGARVLDETWLRPLVGLVTRAETSDRQPLLGDLYYVEQALSGRAETLRGRLDDVLARAPGAVVLADAASPTAAEEEALLAYVDAGGLIVRFAGPRLAAAPDALTPVRLRAGGRLLGGALAWDEPQTIAPFSDDSPFYGLDPPAEATVSRQVLAEPAPDLGEKTWARLADGTPLVTSAPFGQGRVVLFHVTASPDWSDTPLSGLFVEMLRRTMVFAGAGARPNEGALAGPWRLATAVDANGRLSRDANAVRDVRVEAQAFAEARAAASSPPGLYERGPSRAALNALRRDAVLAPPPPLPRGLVLDTGDADGPRPLIGPLLLVGLCLLIVDAIAMAGLSGRLRGGGRAGSTAAGAAAFALVTAAALTPAEPARAQDRGDAAAAGDVANTAADAASRAPLREDFALDALGQLRLAYVVTGDADIDRMSERGLAGLSYFLARRSSVEPGPPLPVNLETDDIGLLPMLYWPTRPGLRPPSAAAASTLETFLGSGGVLVLDTGDGAVSFAQPHPGLTRLSETLDIPPLQRAPNDHVMTRAFYLLQEFPGRWTNTPLWVEADTRGSARDGVSSIIITAADWAAAWAIDEQGQPLAALTPGGPEQREHAIRVGVNLVMYVLTGNYKADQVHIPAILRRLGD